MQTMPTRRLPALALALLVGAGAGAAAAEEQPKLQLMFVQTAEDVQADPDAGTLRLKNVGSQTLYFSDRPERIAGHVTMANYLEEWKAGADNFGEDPPNATLSVYEAGQPDNTLVVVELTDPVVEGDDLVYHYKLINGEMPKAGGEAALFIDWIGPGGGVGAGFHGVGVGARGPGAAGWAGVAARSCAAGGC
jgi:hypothetical protein